ncbi:MAG: FixH family protein, partial [Wenzhouxiangellaceae bacterium]
NEATPWYRQPMRWLVFGLLAWGVTASVILLVVAVNNPPQMETGDYAELGKALVDTHRRADRAKELGLIGSIRLEDRHWSLSLQTLSEVQAESRLLMRIEHPTDAGRDRQVLLRLAESGQYRAAADAWPSRGRIIVSDLEQTWWISSTFEAHESGLEAMLVPERL